MDSTARIGPNALLQLVPVLDRALGVAERVALFARAEVPVPPPDAGMWPEAEVARLEAETVQRRADLAMLRMLGAPPGRVAGLVLWEALWLAAMASVLGLLLGHGLAHGLGWALQAQGLLPVTGLIWLPAEAGVPLMAAGVAALAALLPAMQAYRTDVADLLSQP